MKMRLSTEPQQQQYCYFVAENADDIFMLGQLSKCLPYSSRGFSVDNHLTLGVRINDLVQKAIEEKTIISEN